MSKPKKSYKESVKKTNQYFINSQKTVMMETITTFEDFITACHKVQHDAGSLEHFEEMVRMGVDKLSSGKKAMTDPIAAFIAALLVENNGNIEKAIEDMSFYMSELQRVYRYFTSINL